MVNVYLVQEIVPVQTERTVPMVTMDLRSQSLRRSPRSQIDQIAIRPKSQRNQKHPTIIIIGQRNRQDSQNQTIIDQINPKRSHQIITSLLNRQDQKRNRQTTINQIRSRSKNHQITTNPIRDQTKR